MLAVTGTRAPFTDGGLSKPTTPNTVRHHEADWRTSAFEDT
jgi:hypothetical protein